MKENIKVFNQRVVKKWKRIWKYWIKDFLKNEREHESISWKICYKMKENMKVFHERFVIKWKRIWKYLIKDLLKNERE
jgi:hypothetical protein